MCFEYTLYKHFRRLADMIADRSILPPTVTASIGSTEIDTTDEWEILIDSALVNDTNPKRLPAVR